MEADPVAVRELGARADLCQLRREAMALLRAAREGEMGRFRAVRAGRGGGEGLGDAAGALRLEDAQRVIAWELGFASWGRLKQHMLRRAVEARSEAGGGGGVADLGLAAVLVDACFRGDRSAAGAVLQEDPEMGTYDFGTALCVGDLATVRKVLEGDRSAAVRGVVVPAVMVPGERVPAMRPPVAPLILACRSPLFGRAPFGVGTLEDRAEILRLLVGAGADVNVREPFDPPWQASSGSALYYVAGVHGSVGLTRALLELGASPENPPDDETLYHCVEHKNAELLGLILPRVTNTPWVSYCMFALLDREWAEGVRMFLARGVDLGHRHPARRETPLHWAIKRGRSREVIELLIDGGADLTAEDLHGATPYMMAVRTGHRPAAESMESRGAGSELGPADQLFRAAAGSEGEFAEVSARLGRVTFSAGHAAMVAVMADLGRNVMLRRLLSAGLPADAANEWGHSPMHWACLKGNVEAVEMLLSAGVKADREDPEHHALPAGWAAWGSVNDRTAPGAAYARCIELLAAAGAPMPGNDFGAPEVVEVLRRVRGG